METFPKQILFKNIENKKQLGLCISQLQEPIYNYSLLLCDTSDNLPHSKRIHYKKYKPFNNKNNESKIETSI